MKNGKYSHGKKGLNMKPLAVLLALTLLVGCVIGGTVAWLTAKSDDVTNTFSPSTIDITLTETKTDFQMIPGWTIDKDPVVTVKAGSEDCWVFIEVSESRLLPEYISYTIDNNNWKKLEDAVVGPGEAVYYTFCEDITADRSIKVLLNNQVTVKDTVTKEMMDELTEDIQPTLTFTAYAVQLYKSNDVKFTPAEAWANRPTENVG